MYLSVDTDEGEPVRGLQARDFEIYEDGVRRTSGQALVDPAPSAAHHTLLLLDMTESERAQHELPLLAEATRDFLSALSRPQRVAVYAFDGSTTLHRIAGFSSAPKIERTLKRIAQFRTKHPSANPHAAVLEAKRVLAQSLERAKQPLRFGTLVVFVERAQAGVHAPLAQGGPTSAENGPSVFAVGAGRGIDDATLSSIGVSGYVHVANKGALPRALRTIGKRIADSTNSYYLLRYCSAGRSGPHEVRIRVVDPSTGTKGQVRYTFEEKNFRPRCNEGVVPRFARARGERGTVRGARGARGLPLPLQAGGTDLHPDEDPELGAGGAAEPQASPVEQGPPPLDMEALVNELPPGLQPQPDEEDEEDEEDD